MANNCCNFAERIEIYLNFGYEKVCFCEEVHFHFYTSAKQKTCGLTRIFNKNGYICSR